MSRINEETIEYYEDIADELHVPIDDLELMDEFYPDCLTLIEDWHYNPYEHVVELFGTWEDWLDFCTYYNLEPDTQEEYLVCDDGRLTCVYAFA